MAYTRRTLQLEARIYAVQNYYLFLWGVLKNQVYSDKSETLNDLKENIINVLKDITPEMCKKVTESIIKQCHHCIANNGLQFEHLL